jgi:hypothetical protein
LYGSGLAGEIIKLRIVSNAQALSRRNYGAHLQRRAHCRAGPNTSIPKPLPRTSDGKPNLDGIWQAAGSAAADLQDHSAGLNTLAGRSVVCGGTIPYQPWAAAKKAENFQNRFKADPLAQCYMPGTPRIMYLDFLFRFSRRRRP